MGRDKSRLKLGSKTLLGHIRQTAQLTGLAVRVIRRDIVPRCGPLGGVYTGLKKTSAYAALFLACDMPLITSDLLMKIIRRFESKQRPLFTETDSAGFPFILSREVLPIVEQQLAVKRFSLHALAKVLNAELFKPTRAELPQLANANTPQQWRELRAQIAGLKVLPTCSR